MPGSASEWFIVAPANCCETTSTTQELELSFAQFNNQGPDDIGLDFTSTGINTLFTLANWPQLESLDLYGAHVRPYSLSKFLTRHKSLRSFRVMESCTQARFLKADDFPLVHDGSIMDKVSFPEDTFSELSSLSVPSYFISWVLSSPHRKPLALEDIGRLESEHMTDELFTLLGELPRLRVLRMSSYGADDLRALSSYAPGLREIHGGINPRSLVSLSYVVSGLTTGSKKPFQGPRSGCSRPLSST